MVFNIFYRKRKINISAKIFFISSINYNSKILEKVVYQLYGPLYGIYKNLSNKIKTVANF